MLIQVPDASDPQDLMAAWLADPATVMDEGGSIAGRKVNLRVLLTDAGGYYSVTHVKLEGRRNG